MTYDETLTIMGVLKAAYPSYYKDMNRRDAEGVVGLWASMFADEPAALVGAAVKAFIASDTKGFPPNIGTIKAAIAKLAYPDEMTEQEAWGLVAKAISNGTYHAADEFEALPPVLQRLVGSPSQIHEWAQMDASTVHSVVASNFQRSYKARAAQERELLLLPADVRATMEALASGMALEALAAGPSR